MNAMEPYPPRSKRSKNLPTIAFVGLPVFGGILEFVVLVATAFMFKAPHASTSLLLRFEWWVAMGALYITMVAWVICLVLYLRPQRGFRDIYCLIPLRAYAVHLLLLAALWASILFV